MKVDKNGAKCFHVVIRDLAAHARIHMLKETAEDFVMIPKFRLNTKPSYFINIYNSFLFDDIRIYYRKLKYMSIL